MATFAPPRWPRSAGEVEGGSIGRMRRHLAALREADRPLRDEIAALQRQLAGYRATVEGAGPASDMGAVAAAEAGIHVVAPILEQKVARFAEGSRSLQVLGDRLEDEWRRFLRLVAWRDVVAQGRSAGSPADYVPASRRFLVTTATAADQRDELERIEDELRDLVGDEPFGGPR